MTLADLSPLANHLWQSTTFAVLAWLLTLALRKNRAAVRYWLWLAASVKFLIPFSLLVGIGGQLQWRSTAAITEPQFSNVMNKISRPFAISAEASPATTAPRAPGDLPMVLSGVWLFGFTFGLIFWVRSLRQLRAVVRAATPLPVNLSIPVMSSSALLEPSAFGIRKPILLLPGGITDRLTRAQLEAVLAHELCHVRRRDNLTAAIHMAVETVFWFYPLVWWIRTQLLAERERACDEEVVRSTEDPQVYAEGILSVCKFYLESPLACASGISGADLKKRIEGILSHRVVQRLDWRRKVLLFAAVVTAATGPILIGAAYAPAAQVQSQPITAPAFEVASIKLNRSGDQRARFQMPPGGRINATNITLKQLIIFAYQIKDTQLAGAPGWIDSDRYDISAKAEGPASPDQLQLMMQTLLADRFKLSLRHEMKEMPMYALVVANDGPKLHEAKDADVDVQPGGARPAGPDGPRPKNRSMRMGRGQLSAQSARVSMLADLLSSELGRVVVDKTGLTGLYDFELKWTPEVSQNQMFKGPDAVGSAPAPDTSGPTIFTALQEQLGLKLEAQKGPVEVFVIDHVEKPTEN